MYGTLYKICFHLKYITCGGTICISYRLQNRLAAQFLLTATALSLFIINRLTTGRFGLLVGGVDSGCGTFSDDIIWLLNCWWWWWWFTFIILGLKLTCMVKYGWSQQLYIFFCYFLSLKFYTVLAQFINDPLQDFYHYVTCQSRQLWARLRPGSELLCTIRVNLIEILG